MSTTYRFWVEPLWDRDALALYAIADHDDGSTSVLTVDGWEPAPPLGTSLPIDRVPQEYGLHKFTEDRALSLMVRWENEINEAGPAFTFQDGFDREYRRILRDRGTYEMVIGP